MRVCFRVDASFQIGSGHVARCKTLANELRNRGVDCHFLCRDLAGNIIESISRDGFTVMTLLDDTGTSVCGPDDDYGVPHGAWLETDWMTDAHQTIERLKVAETDWLVVDHYALDARWETHVRPYVRKVMVIDDLADRKHACDILLDQNLVPDTELRYRRLISPHCARLIGPQYALLKSAYGALRLRTPPRLGPVRRILVYFGGADLHNMTGLAVKAFNAMQRDDVTLDVVLGEQCIHADSVRALAHGRTNVVFHEALSSLAPLMLKADVALGAAGLTSWERCCLGLPSLVITLAANQKNNATELDRQGLARWLGDFSDVSVQSLTDSLRDVIDGADIEQWSRMCLNVLDGQGTGRVASILTLDINTSLRCRLAQVSDERLLLRWVNDPTVRTQSFTTAKITAEGHRRWFYQRLRQHEACRIYIVETNEALPVGQVRFDCTQEGWEIDFSLDQIARGRRLGSQLLKTAISKFTRGAKAHANFLGRVKLDNASSQGVFARLGFERSSRGDHIVYRSSSCEGAVM